MQSTVGRAIQTLLSGEGTVPIPERQRGTAKGIVADGATKNTKVFATKNGQPY
jgi:hypothetical protein